MIDLHTHILYGVDDGAQTIEEAFLMLDTAASIGIHTICLTPHVSRYRHYAKSSDLWLERFHVLNEYIKQHELDIALILGSEVDEDDHILENAKNGYTIGDSPYILIDFMMRRTDISEIIYSLNIFGYKVIVAHPERVEQLEFDDLVQLKKEGAIFQVSSSHLVGLGKSSAQKMAKKLLKYDLIDLISSDAHDINDILTLRSAYQYVEKKKGKAIAQKLFNDNPLKIIQAVRK